MQGDRGEMRGPLIDLIERKKKKTMYFSECRNKLRSFEKPQITTIMHLRVTEGNAILIVIKMSVTFF